MSLTLLAVSLAALCSLATVCVLVAALAVQARGDHYRLDRYGNVVVDRPATSTEPATLGVLDESAGVDVVSLVDEGTPQPEPVGPEGITVEVPGPIAAGLAFGDLLVSDLEIETLAGQTPLDEHDAARRVAVIVSDLLAENPRIKPNSAATAKKVAQRWDEEHDGAYRLVSYRAEKTLQEVGV